MGLLDQIGPLLKGKPKALPPDLAGAPTAAFPGAPTKSPMEFGLPDLATAPPGANQQKSMDFALDDIAPSANAPGALREPGGKIGTQLAEGNPVLPPVGGGPTGKPLGLLTAGNETLSAPDSGPKKLSLLRSGTENEPRTELSLGLPEPSSPASGLLAGNKPLPPTQPTGLGGMPMTKSAVPLPPARPAGLGGASEVASTTAPPMPPVRPPGLGVEASGGLMAKAPAIVPPAPPIVPPAPPITPSIGAMAGGAGSLGGAAAGGAMGGLGGLFGALGGMAKAIGGKQGPPPPQAKAPELPAPRAGAEQAQQEAGARAQAPQILQGLLASGAQNTLDPRKRRGLA